MSKIKTDEQFQSWSVVNKFGVIVKSGFPSKYAAKQWANASPQVSVSGYTLQRDK